MRSSCFLYLGALMWFAVAMFSMQLGRLNMDEPWYLTASHLVMRGELPYRDFVYTQTPLLPYVYGVLFKFFGTSLATGRLVSVMLSTLAVTLAMSIARRAGGTRAAGLTLVMLLVMPGMLFFLSIVKTYALTAVWAALAIRLILHQRADGDPKFAFASTLAGGLAGLGRLSFLIFMIVLFLYWIGRGRWKPSGLAVLIIVLVLLPFWVLSNGNFSFNVIEFHQRVVELSDTQPLVASPKMILAVQILLAFTPPLVLLLSFVGIVLTFTSARDMLFLWFRNRYSLLAVWSLACVILFGVHFVSFANHWEYQVPVFIISVPFVAVVTTISMRTLKESFGAVGLLVGVVVIVGIPSWLFQAESLWHPFSTLEVAARQSLVLAQSGKSDDQVLGMYNHLPLAAGMQIVRRNEMGLFSTTTELTELEARRRGFLTETDVTRLLAECVPSFVIADSDGTFFKESAPSRRLIAQQMQEQWGVFLRTNYRLIYKDDFNTIFQLRADVCPK